MIVFCPAPLTKDITILGGGESCLDNHILSAAAAQGRYVVFDDDNSDGWFFRSDHWNFVKRGVDAVVMEARNDLVNPSRPNKYPQASWYHKTNDEYREDWDIEGTIANVNLMFSVIGGCTKNPSVQTINFDVLLTCLTAKNGNSKGVIFGFRLF